MKRLELSAGLASSPLLAQIKSNNHTIQAKLSVLLTCLFIAMTGWILGKVVWLAMPQTSDVAQWKPSASAVASTSKKTRLILTPSKMPICSGSTLSKSRS